MALATTVVSWVVLTAAAPVGSNQPTTTVSSTGLAEADLRSEPLTTPLTCAAGFTRHELDHRTLGSDEPARLFDSNGSGVAADDLDGDGLADIVLGNLEGPNTILWNEGSWTFTAERMHDRGTRTINLVDVDADGLLDIVTTHRGSGVAVFRNLGDRRFEQMLARGISQPAYSMAWGDIDRDGDLDLVTGSYDAELDQRLRSTFLFSDGAGIHLYRNDGTSWVGTRLAEDAQALVVAITDLDRDDRTDVIVGNDFDMHDMTWSVDANWDVTPTEPFTYMSAHTMSIDFGDVDNDGIDEMFTTDMKPASTDPSVLAQWVPLMETMDDGADPRDPQRIRNMLQVLVDGSFEERSEMAGVDTAGWAWSARFGDLDNDGDTDLYVVNGMIAAETFPYLDGAAIREDNVAFENRGDGRFDTADWGLDARESGRGSVLVDLDNDGRLDIVVNNLEDNAIAFQNTLCEGRSLAVTLRQGGANTHAIGGSVELHTSTGVMIRTVRSGGGYLSGSPTVLHFGLGSDVDVERAVVRWPDGTITDIAIPEPGTLTTVERT